MTIPFAPEFEKFLGQFGELCVQEDQTIPVLDGKSQEIRYSIAVNNKKIGNYFVIGKDEGIVSLRYRGSIPGYYNGKEVRLHYGHIPIPPQEQTIEEVLETAREVLDAIRNPKGVSLDQLVRADGYVEIPFP
ncbi:MAG: hypothetical protein EPN86_02585 [Nanoarchaeota archaeon]|nr:MAG: hypothetical protein EPN86_02585 [Nanoarchaeota archaeon]